MTADDGAEPDSLREGDYGVGPEVVSPRVRPKPQFTPEQNARQRVLADRRRRRLENPTQYTLRTLLIVLTGASVIFALGTRVPRPVFAGLLGLAVFLTALCSSWIRHSGAWVRLSWWTLMAIYLLAGIFAVLNG